MHMQGDEQPKDRKTSEEFMDYGNYARKGRNYGMALED
jgi:hypothetical protein